MELTNDVVDLLDKVFKFTQESILSIKWNAKHDNEDIVILFPPCYERVIPEYFRIKFSNEHLILRMESCGEFKYYGVVVRFFAPNNDFYVFSKTYYERSAEFEGKFHFSYNDYYKKAIETKRIEWDKLPNTIGTLPEYLGITLQQSINYSKKYNNGVEIRTLKGIIDSKAIASCKSFMLNDFGVTMKQVEFTHEIVDYVVKITMRYL